MARGGPAELSGTGGPPAMSLVIPTYNEAGYLPRLLDSVDRARARFRHGPDRIEVIVADNASTDATPDIARARGCRVAHVSRRVIAAARNGGAAIATGEWLAFLDADSVMHPDTFNAIAHALARPTVVGGASGVRVERWSPGIALTFAAMMPLLWLTGMDTGVVFCRRRDFERIGGYREDWYYAEDVALLWDLRRLGREHRPRQRLVRLRTKAVTSARKFDQHGDWHYFTSFGPRLAALFRDRHRPGRLARRYWYEVDR